MDGKKLSEVKHVTVLAKLPLSDLEVEELALDLSSILAYFAVLDEIEEERVVSSKSAGQEQCFRSDEVKLCLTQEEALSSAKETYNGLFKVKAVFEE